MHNSGLKVKRYALESYGCQMNMADSELVDGILKDIGLKKTQNLNDADAIFVNTCAIRENAEKKIHSRLGNFHKLKREKPHLIIGVLGCMAQNLKNDLLKNKPYVDIILGPDSYRNLPKLMNRHMVEKNSIVDTKLSRYEVYEDLFPKRNKGVNAWVSIMRGCDKFCSFCIVPFTRGRERSRSVESIVTMQSGSNEILERMNRTYTREHFHHMADTIREIMPNCGLSTDIIVGFPGETEKHFEETLDLMEKIKFNSAFTFKYSPRPYTKAEQFTDQIDETIKKERLDKLINVQKKHTLELNSKKIGKIENVLIEKESKKSSNHWAGRTDSNEWVILEKNSSKIKDIIPVEIVDATGVILHGKKMVEA